MWFLSLPGKGALLYFVMVLNGLGHTPILSIPPHPHPTPSPTHGLRCITPPLKSTTPVQGTSGGEGGQGNQNLIQRKKTWIWVSPLPPLYQHLSLDMLVLTFAKLNDLSPVWNLNRGKSQLAHPQKWQAIQGHPETFPTWCKHYDITIDYMQIFFFYSEKCYSTEFVCIKTEHLTFSIFQVRQPSDKDKWSVPRYSDSLWAEAGRTWMGKGSKESVYLPWLTPVAMDLLNENNISLVVRKIIFSIFMRN